MFRGDEGDVSFIFLSFQQTIQFLTQFIYFIGIGLSQTRQKLLKRERLQMDLGIITFIIADVSNHVRQM